MIKGARRVKGLIRNKAEGDSSKSQALLRHYAMERFLERLANSPYRDNFVLKGGMLMSSLVGVEQRSTMDIDATVKELTLDTGNALKVVGEIASVELDDDMEFEVGDAGEIMEDSEYGGVRIALTARMGTTRIPMKIETTLARGTLNTRMRDFYDVFMLRELDEGLEPSSLRAALETTIEKRGSDVGASNYAQTLSEIEVSETMAKRWRSYGLSNLYASSIAWPDAVGSLRLLYDACWQGSGESD